MLIQRVKWAILLLICIIGLTSPVAAAAKIEVAVNHSQVLYFSGVQRVAIASPEIADVVVVSSSEVLLVGKAPGATTLHVWSAVGRSSYLVEVAADDAAVANEMKSILGYSGMQVSKINKTIILEGTVNDQYQKNRAEKLAAAYGEKVINLLEVTRPVQVKIEAKVVEVNREKAKGLGIKWGNSPAIPGTFGFGQSQSNSVVGRSLGDLGTFTDINAQLTALVQNGVAKILSQPNVITLSGGKANIMVGGQIPVPVALENNKITVEWKDYGIKLDIAPEVNGEGLISSIVKAEVSTLDWNSTKSIQIVGDLKIPPLKLRKTENAIALSSGQTMAIGGLISSETTQDITRIPLLSDIPILGKLFKSKSFSRGETELLIFITPSIVNPAEYIPDATAEMDKFIKENPWGGK